ncbi:MAG: 7-cyano-7-deazaguanine synthase QueC [Beijerinckiaceae bacterium]
MTEPAQTASENQSALVLFSGGQDSSTCLAWALERFERVETVGFDYGQRHTIELTVRGQLRDAMRSIKQHWQNRLGDDHMINLSALGEISQTSLTRDMEMAMGSEGLPNSFVPGRNLIFLTFAAAIAYRRGIRHLVTGVCETDYSGYPDCRDDTIKAMQVALGLGMERRFVLHTPLMWIDKAQTWSLTEELGGSALIEVIRDISHSCYLGERKAHDWGHGCGHCPACELRADGFMRWRKAAK